MIKISYLSAIIALTAGPVASYAQAPAANFPTRPIRFLVPVPPGATTDIVTRLVAQKMGESFGQQVVVDNRPGGVMTIATDLVAKAPPDGHTIATLLTPTAVNPYVLKNLPYNTERELQAVSQMVAVPGVMTMNPGVPANNLKEVIALARAKPGALNYGSPGQLTSGHLSMELLKLNAGINIQHVPYKGGAPAITDLIGGQIQFLISGPPGVLPHIKAGRLKAIATTSARRSPGLPDTPTFMESGVPNFDTSEWYGVFAPAGLPKPVLDKLSRELVRIVKLPDVAERLSVQGAIPVGSSAEAFTQFVKQEMNLWGGVARKIGLKPD
ncbi:MAG: tripartite tricarboxylate transporter substrate binding protein [Betaproteobacteria bacterium]|nr:tripartite tricarboxylate transporter substrate binding protein [Betaproteobacteria bacterium]